MEPNALFAEPRHVVAIDDCDFYHTMEIPGSGVVEGQWDLRGMVDEYLGGVAFAGKRVLEIGPASGFLTAEMERRGASVVAVEVPDDPGWDFVPYPESRMAELYDGRRVHMNRIKNSFWFTHKAHNLSAKLIYADVYRLPEPLGSFDVAVMAAVLLHCRNPLRIVEQCARRARELVIADRFFPELEGDAVCRLAPNRDNFAWDTWWQFSTKFFTQFLEVMGFSCQTSTYVHQRYGTLFTVRATAADAAASGANGQAAHPGRASGKPGKFDLGRIWRPLRARMSGR